MKFDLKARVVDNVCLTGGNFRLRVEAPQIAAIARPGQFCMIRPEFSGDSLLRRPFSIAAVRDKAILEFAYVVVGRGTRLLAMLEAGKNLLCLGPLGNEFPIVEGRRAIVVAGGIGVAPFPFLNAVLNNHGIFPETYYGARTASELIYLEELNQLSERLVITTDDGSTGLHGFVTQALEKDLDSASIQHPASGIQHPVSSIQHPVSSIQHPASGIQHPVSSIQHPASTPQHPVFYACGPHPMLRKVKEIAEKRGIPAYLSMEEMMGCGIGICVGCPIPGVTREGQNTNYLCCKDGPIFPSTAVRL